jgi:hypothetical protein
MFCQKKKHWPRRCHVQLVGNSQYCAGRYIWYIQPRYIVLVLKHIPAGYDLRQYQPYYTSINTRFIFYTLIVLWSIFVMYPKWPSSAGRFRQIWLKAKYEEFF